MPPALAAQFTTGELAVLRIVADEVRDKGRCDRTYAEMAARAGVCRRTASNAVRRAGRLGLVNIEERPRRGKKHLANLVRVVSREWRVWIDRRRPASREHVHVRAEARDAAVSVRSGEGRALSAWEDRGKKIGHHGQKDSRGYSK